jgi:hypothetical protein
MPLVARIQVDAEIFWLHYGGSGKQRGRSRVSEFGDTQ